MSQSGITLPHFLRVVRRVAKVSGVVIPVATFTAAVPGFGCGAKNGAVTYSGAGGQGGGGPMGVTRMPDGGTGGAGTGGAGTGGQGGGGSVGVTVMPDAGLDGSH